jgi:hypothetical protein
MDDEGLGGEELGPARLLRRGLIVFIPAVLLAILLIGVIAGGVTYLLYRLAVGIVSGLSETG